MDAEAPEILVLDDEAAISELLVRSLRARGVAAEAAPDPDAAERRLAAEPGILVLVSDVHMPGANGAELASRLLAARGERDALEVILMTGDALEADIPRERVFDVVQKPFRLSEIHGRIRAAAERAAGRRDAAAALEDEEAAEAAHRAAVPALLAAIGDGVALRLALAGLRPALAAALRAGPDPAGGPALTPSVRDTLRLRRTLARLDAVFALAGGGAEPPAEAECGALAVAAASRVGGAQVLPGPPDIPLRADRATLVAALAALLADAGPDGAAITWTAAPGAAEFLVSGAAPEQGLGLALARAVAEAQGGEVRVRPGEVALRL
jgi:CheY-like chemotaxis protein